MENSPDKEDVKAGLNIFANVVNVTDATTVSCDALEPNKYYAFQISEVPMTESFLLDRSPVREHREILELETTSALHQNVKVVLADPQ